MQTEINNDSAVQLLRAAYEAFQARDTERVLAMMDPEVDWPNGMEGGRMQGRAAVREYWARQFQLVDPSVEPISFQTDQQGRTVVTVHQVVRDLNGQVLLDKMVKHAYTIENGLIRRMDIDEPESRP